MKGEAWKHAVNALCAAIMVLSYVGSALYMQLYQFDNINGPALSVYAVHSSYVLYVVPWAVIHYFERKKTAHKTTEEEDHDGHNTVSSGYIESEETTGLLSKGDDVPKVESKKSFTWKGWIIRVAILSTLSYTFEWTWYLSLRRTPASINVSIYNTSSAFVYIFSLFMLGEVFSFLKAFAVCLCVVGSIVVALLGDGTPSQLLSESSQPGGDEQRGDWLGYLELMLSVFLYSLYTVLYSKICVDPTQPNSIANSFKTSWLIGMCTIVIDWVFAVISYYQASMCTHAATSLLLR